ncbi:hypothetical protein GLOTRDRAFT_91955 [Gloeophyllum trabeum ATCC 11539]|uniref:DUF6534 domain-containing protein n=1 Tax=Gloeophyllum trabeum (strain ATCC 11539 / FP-39264 / Madison 617) TaxID=670483 RepID=S7RV11_GLOTA|nr:uncharacterized protein GLOTRDRAFT_91955 [Gloeophyllum trabeum ATCC 11539]EPQ58595.1 hypothetical protein GLOTRDRAFT_91955 [Gloeophyllum trabeum ATCC 11539]
MVAEDKTWGAGLVGLVVAVIYMLNLLTVRLYGITNAQTYYYFVNYEHDPVANKLLVCVLWTLDTAHTVIITHSVYYYVITHFGIPEAEIVCFHSPMVLIWVSSYLIRRVWCMSKGIIRLFWHSLVWGPSIDIASGFAYGIRLVLTHVPEIVDLINMALGSTVATDVLLTVALSFLLNRARSGINRTDKMINTLILYAVNNGLLTSNTLLATLNARRSISGKGEFGQEYTTSLRLNHFRVVGNTNVIELTPNTSGNSHTRVGTGEAVKTYAGQSQTVLNPENHSIKSARGLKMIIAQSFLKQDTSEV